MTWVMNSSIVIICERDLLFVYALCAVYGAFMRYYRYSEARVLPSLNRYRLYSSMS